MACKTLLLPIRESEVAESLVETAVGIAARQGAHLTALYVHPPAKNLTPYATIGLTRAMRENIEAAATAVSTDQAARLREILARHAGAAGVALRPRDAAPGEAGAELVEASGVRSELIAAHGRLSDLVIVPRPVRAAPAPSSFEAAVRETGRPVLMIPRGAVPEAIGRQIVVGWNGSKEAARALATALPYLGGSLVHVASSRKRMDQHPNAEQVATYLACQGVDARVRVFESGKGRVADTLLEICADTGADLLVVGGYSRPRVREIVMGGVTGDLLARASVPVFMVH